jgi:hypothetical protein
VNFFLTHSSFEEVPCPRFRKPFCAGSVAQKRLRDIWDALNAPQVRRFTLCFSGAAARPLVVIAILFAAGACSSRCIIDSNILLLSYITIPIILPFPPPSPPVSVHPWVDASPTRPDNKIEFD